MKYKVKELADIVGVSVRTLHHYDNIGLLKPEYVSISSYRIYGRDNVKQLQQILFLKELGFSLKEIKSIVNDKKFNSKDALRKHKKLLVEKKIRLEKIIKSVESTISFLEKGEEMSISDMFSSFDTSEIEKCKEQYREEVEKKWGHTSAYKQSQQKTTKYTAKDWENIQQELREVYQQIANNMDQSVNSPTIQRAVARLRSKFSEYFYDCTPEIFRGLAEMYISDVRFTKFYENIKPGLTVFLSDAIAAYCDSLDS